MLLIVIITVFRRCKITANRMNSEISGKLMIIPNETLTVFFVTLQRQNFLSLCIISKTTLTSSAMGT